MIKSILFFGGASIVLLGGAGPYLLAEAPASIQSNETLQPIGSFVINNASLITIIGLLLIVLAVFFF